MIKKLYLIGGAPRTGKTTVAKAIAQKLNSNYVSMDDIRGLLIALEPKHADPALFYDEKQDIADFYKKYPHPEQVFTLERNQNNAAEFGIEVMINSFYDWDSAVIEGIGITPEFTAKLSKNDDLSVKSLFLIAQNTNILTDRIYSAGLWDNTEKYPDKYKETEAKWTKMYNEWFAETVQKNGMNAVIIDNKSIDELVTEVLKLW